MKFEQYKFLKNSLIEKASISKGQAVGTPSPLVWAYLGDALYTLYVRERLVKEENNKVRVLNDVSAGIVSAVMQAKASDALLELLTEEEHDILRRGRNTKSSVPKSASVAEYRKSTGFECLLGWLHGSGQDERMYILMDKALDFSLEYLKTGEGKDES